MRYFRVDLVEQEFFDERSHLRQNYFINFSNFTLSVSAGLVYNTTVRKCCATTKLMNIDDGCCFDDDITVGVDYDKFELVCCGGVLHHRRSGNVISLSILTSKRLIQHPTSLTCA